jgi:hypothetical protein
MTYERVSNKSRIDRQDEQKAEALKLEKIKEDIKLQKIKAMNRVKQIRNDDTSNLIQKLLGQQSDQIKQDLLKKSVQTIDMSFNNYNLEEEVNKEMDKLFGNKHVGDSTDISDEYLTLSKKTNIKKNPLNPHKNFSPPTTDTDIPQTKMPQQRIPDHDPNAEFIDVDDEHSLLPIKSQKIVISPPPPKKTSSKKSDETQQLNQYDIKEFATLVSKYAITQDPNLKNAIETQKKQLLKRGISEKHVDYVSQKIGQVVCQHIVYDLKQSLIHYHMSKGFSKQEQIQRQLSYKTKTAHLETLIESNGISANAVSDQINHHAKQELESFLYQESVHQFTKHSLGQISIKEFTEELVKLQNAAHSAGVEISEKNITEKICAAIDHLGLAEFTPPQDDANSQKKQPQQWLLKEETLDDKLRYMYMMQALHPSLRNKIELHFKMKKCRNGMIKLGIHTDEKEDRLKKQGHFLAAKQFMEELALIFKEEATLPDSVCSAYKVLRKKKSFILNQLRKIDHAPSLSELNRIKTNMYHEIYGLIKEELLQLENVSELKNYVHITRKIKHLKSVIERIRTEVIIYDHSPTIDRLVRPIQMSSINEGA